MTSAHLDSDDEPIPDEEGTRRERVERSVPHTSRVIRIIQVALTLVLLAIIIHGLVMRGTGDTGSFGENYQTVRHTDEKERISHATNTSASSSAETYPQQNPTLYLPRYSDEEALHSLHDIRDYLELHRVKRETRNYQLGVTSRDALVQMAIANAKRSQP